MIRIILMLSLVALASACGNSQDEAMEKAMEAQLQAAGHEGDVEVSSHGEKMNMKIETEEGTVETTYSQNEIPEDFPDDVPLYEGAELMGATNMSLEGYSNYSVHASTSDPVDEVQKSLDSEARKSGWEQVMSQNMQGMVMLMYQKESRRLSYNITIDEGKTTVIATVGEQGEE